MRENLCSKHSKKWNQFKMTWSEELNNRMIKKKREKGYNCSMQKFIVFSLAKLEILEERNSSIPLDEDIILIEQIQKSYDSNVIKNLFIKSNISADQLNVWIDGITEYAKFLNGQEMLDDASGHKY